MYNVILKKLKFDKKEIQVDKYKYKLHLEEKFVM